jgi:hypothetical protein
MDYKVRPIKSCEVTEWLQKKHYARRRASISFAFGLFDSMGILSGICTFGSPPNCNLCAAICGEQFKDVAMEFNRLCLLEPHGRNVASFFVAHALKMLPVPKVLVSYADSEQGHVGYIYQATNWLYTGESRPDTVFYDDRSGKKLHRKTVFDAFGTNAASDLPDFLHKQKQASGKHRYIMFLGSKKQKKEMLAALRWPILPYPKGESQRYDASHKPITQMVMF